MTNIDDPYQFSMDDSISDTFCTRSSSRNRKATTNNNTENNLKKKVPNKRTENVLKTGQQRIVTRSSQKPATPTINENDNSFMSNLGSGFSQFINQKKRQRDEKKTKTFKRPKITTYVDENEPPDNEYQQIEQVKLIYETSGGRTNIVRAAATNAKILATRNVTNTTYNINDQNHIIDDTQTETLAIPDTMDMMDTQHNDSSWQKDIDRLMKKLEEPTNCLRTQIQIEPTQTVQDEREEENEVLEPIYPSQTRKTHQKPIQKTTQQIQTGEIGTQTENIENSSTSHQCCQDVSICPCVLRYSKLERLFMEKMSRFINIVPTVSNQQFHVPMADIHYKRRYVQYYPRLRRFRNRKRIYNRTVPTSTSNNQSTTVEEIFDERVSNTDNQTEENNEIIQEQNESMNINGTINPTENIVSITITKEKEIQPIDDLSAIEKLDTTTTIDQTSTLLIPSTDNTYSTDRHFVLTTSSLDENQKSQFRLFISRFGVSTSSSVDSSTTHIIVNENSSLICPLTGKIIQGIARHLFIVSHRWLNECLSENIIVDERPYEIRGDTSLGSDHGGMRRSRLTPSNLLDKYSICLRCSSNDCAPLQTIEQVQELIHLSGAKLVQNFSEIKTIDKDRQMVLVLGINGFTGGEKKRKALLDTCQQFNVQCVNIHWLLISIAKYNIQPFENYDINQV